MPELIAVNTAAAPAPVGPYNQAVRAGDLLFCSGQIALDPASGALVGDGDVETETRQVLANLQAVLAAAGAPWGGHGVSGLRPVPASRCLAQRLLRFA